MVRFLGQLLCASVLLAGEQVLATEAADAPLGLMDFGQSEAHLEVFSASPEYTRLTLDQPNVVMDEPMVGYETYHAFRIPGEPWIWSEGSPAVPQVTRFYRIPNTGSVDLVVTAAEYDLIEGIRPMPVQEETVPFGELLRDPSVYTRDGWYPEQAVEMSQPAIMRDFRVVTVTFHPVQVNPVTGQARIYRHLSAELVGNDLPGENELLNPRQPSGVFAPVYRAHIANLDESALDDATTTPGTYLILCKTAANARRWADSLFEWKTRMGFTVSVDARASWTAAQMVTAITTAYANANPPLEFVCLIGDPQWSDGVPTDGSSRDHSFGRVVGTDHIEDVGVGRLSGSSLNEMATINAKIMRYERDPYMTDTLWYHKAFLYAGVCQSVASNYTLVQWMAQMFRLYTGVNNTATATHDATQVSEATVTTQVNGGVAFFLWRGCWIGGMQNTLANQTNPNNRNPITLTITCATGDFESGLAVSESWLVAGTPTNPTGGICGIGTATAGTHPPQNYTLAGGLVYNICNIGQRFLGPCLSGAKLWLHLTWGLDATDAINFSTYCNLLGDPGLSMWTDVPEVLSVTHPTVLNVGARQLAVQVVRTADNVPVEEAVVVAWKRGADSTLARGVTDAEGRITLPVNVNAAGELLLTVTKRNHKPYLISIPCVVADQMTMFSSYVIDDDNAGGTSGNADHIVNPDETIDLITYLRNSGTGATATGISALLSSTSPRVTVLQPSATYPNLAPGDSAVGSVPFRIRIASDAQNREPIQLQLTVNSGIGQTYGTIELRCVAAAAQYVSHSVTGGTFNPGTTRGLNVTIRNNGAIPMTGVSAQLVSLSPFVEVDDENGTFGDMAVNGTATNSADPFIVTSNPLAFRGHQAAMLLIVTSGSNHRDSTSFVLPVGTASSTDPTGPDSYGYFAYDNTDVTYTDSTYPMCPTYNYVNISAGLGTNLNLNDTGENTNTSQVWSTARRLPFPFKYYGQIYDSVTICSNGWMAFGNQAWNAAFRNYPIPAMVAPEAMIAPYWDDLATSGSGKGVWMYSDTSQHRFIVQWKGGAGSSYGTSLDFEVILYDTTFYPTFDGNGMILVQYNTVSMNLPDGSGNGDASGCSIGIQAPRSIVGLSYAFRSTYAPGAATVTNGRAIRFTTNARKLFGDITGVVTDAATGNPMAGAVVSVNGYNYRDTTAADGSYYMHNVLIGTYTLTATAYRYNSASVQDVIVELDSLETVNFSLTHPEIMLSMDSLMATVGTEPLDTTFDIINNGNGPMDYSIAVYYAGDENPNPWDRVGEIAVSEATGDFQVMGCEFVDGRWWVTGGGGPQGQNMFYLFDRRGNPVGTVPQPSTTPVGWFDLAWDGEYLYGSESHDIVGMDLQGSVRVTIPSPMNPSRAIAYDPGTDHFWVTDYTQDFYEIDRLGNIIQTVPNHGANELSVTGLAWHPTDPNGYKLYIFSQDGVGLTRVTRLHPLSHARETVADLRSMAGDRSGGCTITPGWNSMLLVFGAVMQNANGDRLQIHEITFNTTWISIAPAAFQVPGGGVRPITVGFDPTDLLPDIYRVNLCISSVVLDTTLVLPVTLTVLDLASPPSRASEIPATYALRQNFPNPFNPTTTIRYELAHDGATRLTVYNLLGEEVAVLVNERQAAGRYEVRFDAADLPSGMYIYRLESGSFSQAAKMILMK